MITKKKYEYNNDKLESLQNAINKNTDNLWHPDLNIKFKKLKTNSCFNINYHKSSTEYSNLDFKNINKNTETILKCKKIDMHLNKKQKKILSCWFNAYIEMYNETITYIKNTISINDFKKLKELWIEKKQLTLLIDNNKEKIKELILKKENFNNELIISQKNIKINKDEIKHQQIMIQKLKLKNLNIKQDKLKKIENNINKLIQIVNFNINNFNIEQKKLKEKEEKINILFNKINSKINNTLNWQKIRTHKLKEIRDKIIEEKYIKQFGKKTHIKTHIMDTAIKMACSAYKTCKSNFMAGYIKNFRIKFWRHNKIKKILEIEAGYILNHQICEKILGKIKYTYKTDFFNEETQKYTKKIQKYILEKSTVKILYDSSTNRYQLLISESVNKTTTKSTKFIGIDQGIRTFASCITNNEVLEIGTDINENIKKCLLRTDNINNNDKIEPIKKTIKCAKYMRKIKNKIEDIHWKTIKFLTDNYKTIVIGDLSMKDASNNETSKITKMCKRIGLMMSHSKFRQRLQYKCAIKGINLKIINEWGTSKTCSFCGNFKAELKGEHIYKCNICKREIGRDIGSSRNILFIGLQTNNK